MKLNWFSPLPPARTGVARYTTALLPALRRVAAVTVWTDQAVWERSVEHHAGVRRYAADRLPWAELNRADATVYHLGNDARFHASILAVSGQHPGLVVLHDLCLQYLFTALYRDRNDRDGYLELVRRHHGQAGATAAAAHWGGIGTTEDVAELYPLTRPALARALGVVVHTRDAFELLRRDERRPVAYISLPHPAAARRAAADAQPPFRMICFGHVGPNRRIDALLEALAQFPDRTRFRLAIYGQVWESERLRRRIRSLGLESVVTLHGFVDDAGLDDALANAHLAVNLRYPTMGEASLSQLQIWEHALPSLVSSAGWYAGLPPDTVAFVRPEQERADLQTHLSAFLDDPARFARMGLNGRRLLETQHAPDAYARAVVDFAAKAAAFHPQAAAFELAERVGLELGRWLTPASTPDTLRRIAEEIEALTGV